MSTAKELGKAIAAVAVNGLVSLVAWVLRNWHKLIGVVLLFSIAGSLTHIATDLDRARPALVRLHVVVPRVLHEARHTVVSCPLRSGSCT